MNKNPGVVSALLSTFIMAIIQHSASISRYLLIILYSSRAFIYENVIDVLQDCQKKVYKNRHVHHSAKPYSHNFISNNQTLA